MAVISPRLKADRKALAIKFLEARLKYYAYVNSNAENTNYSDETLAELCGIEAEASYYREAWKLLSEDVRAVQALLSVQRDFDARPGIQMDKHLVPNRLFEMKLKSWYNRDAKMTHYFVNVKRSQGLPRNWNKNGYTI